MKNIFEILAALGIVIPEGQETGHHKTGGRGL